MAESVFCSQFFCAFFQLDSIPIVEKSALKALSLSKCAQVMTWTYPKVDDLCDR